MEDKVLNAIYKLEKQLQQWKESKEIPSQSKDLTELFSALAKAQGEMPLAKLNNENPYFKSKYADLKSIVEASRPALSKHGLSVMQQILPSEEGANYLHTRLCHSSGQWIESKMRIVPPKHDIQTLGSYISYLRRYSMASLVGVVTGDEDDDGEVAMIESRDRMAKGPPLKNEYHPKKESYETITKEQLEELEYELGDWPDLAEEIMDRLQLQSMADLPKSKFLKAIQRVREIKNAREGK